MGESCFGSLVPSSCLVAVTLDFPSIQATSDSRKTHLRMQIALVNLLLRGCRDASKFRVLVLAPLSRSMDASSSNSRSNTLLPTMLASVPALLFTLRTLLTALASLTADCAKFATFWSNRFLFVKRLTSESFEIQGFLKPRSHDRSEPCFGRALILNLLRDFAAARLRSTKRVRERRPRKVARP